MAGWIPFRCQSIGEALVMWGKMLDPSAYWGFRLTPDSYFLALALPLGMVRLLVCLERCCTLDRQTDPEPYRWPTCRTRAGSIVLRAYHVRPRLPSGKSSIYLLSILTGRFHHNYCPYNLFTGRLVRQEVEDCAIYLAFCHSRSRCRRFFWLARPRIFAKGSGGSMDCLRSLDPRRRYCCARGKLSNACP